MTYLAGFVVGFVVVAAASVIRWIAPKPSRPPIPLSPIGERIRFHAYLACFVLAPFIGIWVSFATVRKDFWQVASLVFGAIWLLWGIVPLAVCMVRRPSTFASFKAKVERYSGGPFHYVVCLWALCVGLAFVQAARLLVS
jgi:hypothetical protein